ncbi:Na+/H+ antiporter NhaA [Arcanobacterium buesumense]|uniref:Na+/H+ antiporter NhaA n=1 Tax=Arcanobacterium buesumense TaxID=2722751 RepID=UPI001FFD0B86|nr:Na+/H+ antiporter NhaA [Arcanobacterium buesumense]
MTEPQPSKLRTILSYGSYAEHVRIGGILRKETTGGIALMIAAVIAIVWANSPWSEAYLNLRDTTLSIDSLHLHLSVGHWAADGLLAIFFFLVGLELKQEFAIGDLRSPSRAIVPVVAAIGGVIVPAGIYAAINWGHPETIQGWAIPTATDIAFAVAVLAIIGSHLPSPLRLFLLTLAVVDDLIAITIIAIFYTNEVHALYLALFVIPVMIFAFLVRRFHIFWVKNRWASWLILFPVALTAWYFLHEAGIHATIAGVVLGFVVPVSLDSTTAQTALAHHRPEVTGHGSHNPGLVSMFEHGIRPLSSGFAVPVFAFFSAGVAIGGWDGLLNSLSSPVALGIIVGLVLGKPIGIVLSTFLLTKLTRANLDSSITWFDTIGVGFLAGIGFTVSLLVGELSFGLGDANNDAAKVGILLASVLAALLAVLILTPRNRYYKELEKEKLRDEDGDGIPDVFEISR